MEVRRSPLFEAELAAQLHGNEGRPTSEHFEVYLAEAVELVFSLFWDDSRIVEVVNADHDIRMMTTVPVRPFILPPGVFLARGLEENTVELIGVDFDWEFYGRG